MDYACRCPEFVVDVLVGIARERGIHQPRITFESGSSQGDGFIGVVTRVVIVDENSGAEIRLICKHLKQNPNDTNTSFTTMDMFKREIFIYQRVLPEIVRLQHEKGVQENEGFFSFPTCHFAGYCEDSSEAALIFEDLKFEGFKMLEKRKIPDTKHVMMLFKQLGRLHAASLALREHKPDIMLQFQFLDDVLTKFMQRQDMESLQEQNCRLLQTVLVPEEVEASKFFKRWETTMWADVAERIQGDNAEPYAVINHGDCWINNLMFYYPNEEASPTKITLLDWQMSRYASPVLDIVYFIFTCTDKPFRDQHLRVCLDLYYNSLVELLEKLGGDATKQFPLNVFEEHLKKFGKMGMAMCTFTTPLDTGYVLDYNEEPERRYKNNKDAYDARMRGNVTDFIEYGYMN
uniref:Putative juvenile hormone-inducible protein n=1 Tax=Nyssomyia neivai TaxID=330878 RepID=A0A1L8DKW5_9DIPT